MTRWHSCRLAAFYMLLQSRDPHVMAGTIDVISHEGVPQGPSSRPLSPPNSATRGALQSSLAPAGAFKRLEGADAGTHGLLHGCKEPKQTLLLVCLFTALGAILCWHHPHSQKHTNACASRSHTYHLGVCSKRGQVLLCSVVQQGQGVQVARPRLHIADGGYPGVPQRNAPAGKGHRRICMASLQQRQAALHPCFDAASTSGTAPSCKVLR